MLEFNHEHKMADLSNVKAKTEKAKNTGKVMLCGITLSALLLLSGCGSSTQEQSISTKPITTSSAIIMKNGNAMIVDLRRYDRWIYETHGRGAVNATSNDRTWMLYTKSGDTMIVDFESVIFINGENSHQKAETIAESLVDTNGTITCYDEISDFGRTR